MKQQMTWRPIKSAPKDGMKILLYVPSFADEWCIVLGWWQQRKSKKAVTSGWRSEFWLFARESDPIENGPSHWMPLPDRPSWASAARAHEAMKSP